MRLAFDAHLVNKPFGDPGVYVDFRHERRAIAFDLGENTPLAPRHLLRLTHAFVSHAHMDHFIGFDRVVRVCIGRHAGIRLFGPSGFVARVEHRLASYTWDRVDRYEVELALQVTEVDGNGGTRSARFRPSTGFRREEEVEGCMDNDVLVDEPSFRVRYAMLDHRTPCLGFLLEEKAHASVWKNRLAEMGLRVGPWVAKLKQAVLAGAVDDELIEAHWHDGEGEHRRSTRLGELRSAVSVERGQRVGYVTDVLFHEANIQRIVRLVRDADLLFIESVFLQADALHASQKQHLTARQAGTIARLAGVRNVEPFHFSPRYSEREAELRAELAAAFAGDAGTGR
jgi:ribonuclease Z